MATFYKTYVAQVKKKSPGFYRDFSEFLLFLCFQQSDSLSNPGRAGLK